MNRPPNGELATPFEPTPYALPSTPGTWPWNEPFPIPGPITVDFATTTPTEGNTTVIFANATSTLLAAA